MIDQAASTLEVPADAGKGPAGVVQRWLLELDLADKEEKDWRKAASATVARYRDEEERKPSQRKGRSRFNILWANTELMRPALYSATPRPDIRPRNTKRADPLARAVSEVLEAAATYTVDVYDFDHVMSLAVLDYLLPGRAVTRVDYTPTTNEAGEVVNERAECSAVQWEGFRRGPGACWADVNWIAFEHLLKREEIDEKFGKDAGVELDVELKGEEGRKDDHNAFKRGRVWEVWDKDKREILWIAPSNKDRPVKVEADRLKLRGFFPIPRPLYAMETTETLVPVEEYRLYRDQADELDEITQRIRRVVQATKVRGIYDAAIAEMGRLLESGDNELIPSEGATNTLAQTQTLDRHVWMLPIDQMAKVLVSLYQQRESLKQTIYEITGLSDILRGSSDPGETLGAQQLKAQTGSLRLQRRQREVQRYARDLIEMKIEIMAEHFAPETLAMMVGAPAQEVATYLEILRSGTLRDYRIDIETDSTIAADKMADQQQVSEFLQGVGGFAQSMAGAMQMGLVTPPAAKAILAAAVRRFKFGRAVEELIEDEAQQGQQQQGPSPEQLQAMQQQMQEQAMQQAEQAVAGQKEQVQAEATKVQAERKGVETQVQSAQKEIAMEREAVKLEQREAMVKVSQAMVALEKRANELGMAKNEVSTLLEQAQTQGEDVDGRAERMGEMEGDMKEMASALAQLAQVLAQGLQQNQEATQALLSAMSAPREIVRDGKGRVTGARVRLDS